MRTTLSDWKIGPTACSMYCLVIRHPILPEELLMCAYAHFSSFAGNRTWHETVFQQQGNIEHGGRGLTIMIFDYIAYRALEATARAVN